jgi:hypothetical protein
MRKLLLALALWLAPTLALAQGAPIGPTNWFTCNNTASVTGTAATSQKIITGITTGSGPGGTAPRIFVCGWTFTNTAASGTVTVNYGTGSNCGTNTVAMSPALSVGSTQLAIYTQIPSLQTAPGVDLCVTTSVATINGLVWYTQF